MSHLHDWYLHGEDEQTLQRYYKADLQALCKARGMEADAGTKADLVDALLHWVRVDLLLLTHTRARWRWLWRSCSSHPSIVLSFRSLLRSPIPYLLSPISLSRVCRATIAQTRPATAGRSRCTGEQVECSPPSVSLHARFGHDEDFR